MKLPLLVFIFLFQTAFCLSQQDFQVVNAGEEMFTPVLTNGGKGSQLDSTCRYRYRRGSNDSIADMKSFRNELTFFTPNPCHSFSIPDQSELLHILCLLQIRPCDYPAIPPRGFLAHYILSPDFDLHP